MKNPQKPAGIEPATFRFVAQHLNHCATAVPVAIVRFKYHIQGPPANRAIWQRHFSIFSVEREGD